MLGLIKLIVGLVLDLFRSRAALGNRLRALRQQIIVLRRGRVARLPFSAADRFVLGWVCRLFPNTLEALATIRPETVMRWHREAPIVLALEVAVATSDKGPWKRAQRVSVSAVY